MDINKLKEEFLRINQLGFVKNIKRDINDGAAGNTFEHLIGVAENNLREADYEGFEIKTKKWLLGKNSSTPYSLFSLKPTSPKNGDNYMRENWGVYDRRYPSIKRFSTSVFANKWSLVYKKNYLKLEVNRDERKVFMVYSDIDQNVLDKSIYWSFEDIAIGADKLKNMIIVDAEVKEIDGNHYFKYTDATILYDYYGHNNFIDLLEQGFVRYDNRLGVHGPQTSHPGTPHNHGGGFRIAKNQIDKLYETKLEIQKP